MIPESDYILLARWSARFQLESGKIITNRVRTAIRKNNNLIVLKEAYNYLPSKPIKHNANVADCACRLCELRRQLASLNIVFHRVKRSYYDDNGFNLAFDRLYSDQTVSEREFFETLETDHKKKVTELRSIIKATEDSIAYLLE